MDRRTFLSGSLASIGTLLGLGITKNRVNTTYTVDVKLYQTQTLTRALEQLGREPDWAVNVGKTSVKQKLGEQFPDLSVNIEQGDLDVSTRITKPKEEKTVVDRLQSWWNWFNAGQRKNPVKTSNILIGLLGYESERTIGIANTRFLPTCCSAVNGYGVVWHNMLLVNEERMLEGILLHEIGHTLGLKHYHGRNYRNGEGELSNSIMLSNGFAESVGENVFGQSVQPTNTPRLLKFNDQLTEENLSI